MNVQFVVKMKIKGVISKRSEEPSFWDRVFPCDQSRLRSNSNCKSLDQGYSNTCLKVTVYLFCLFYLWHLPLAVIGANITWPVGSAQLAMWFWTNYNQGQVFQAEKTHILLKFSPLYTEKGHRNMLSWAKCLFTPSSTSYEVYWI